MNHKPKRTAVTFYIEQQRRIVVKIQHLAERMAAIQPYPKWIHGTLNVLFSPFSKQVRKLKVELEALKAEYNTLKFKLDLMIPVNNLGGSL